MVRFLVLWNPSALRKTLMNRTPGGIPREAQRRWQGADSASRREVTWDPAMAKPGGAWAEGGGGKGWNSSAPGAGLRMTGRSASDCEGKWGAQGAKSLGSRAGKLVLPRPPAA